MEDFSEYRVRMLRSARSFSYFGIQPIWHPGEKDVEGFIHDEVVRQFHDPGVEEDGGRRVKWMTEAWEYAEDCASRGWVPAPGNILDIGGLVEPHYNLVSGVPEFRHENVYIGNRMGVYPPYLADAVDALTSVAGDVKLGKAGPRFIEHLQIEGFDQQVKEIETIDEWYLAFEWIHPFRDGNGRTGKILHNWLGGTLNDPVLVPDYFGGGNP